MNREIKFRTWDKRLKQMFDIHSISLPNTGGAHEEGRNIVYMQFTGLKDKNGREIYEGDIIHFDDLDVDVRVGRTKSTERDAEVVYSEHGTKFGAKVEGYGIKQFYPAYTEIIGNTYENPELVV